MALRKLSPYFLVLALGSGCAAKRSLIVDAPVVQSDCAITQASREIEGKDEKDGRVVAEHHHYLGWDKDCGDQREKELRHEISFKLLVEALSAPGIEPRKKSEIADTILAFLQSEDSNLKRDLQRAMEEKNITVRDIQVHVMEDPTKSKRKACKVIEVRMLESGKKQVIATCRNGPPAPQNR